MEEFDYSILYGRSGSVCYPHPVGLAALALPHTTVTPTRTSRFGDPFLFRGVEDETYERSLTGALIEETRRRRGNFSPKQDPIFPESLQGSVNIAIWHYHDLDLVNATLQGICDQFDAPTSIARDPGRPLNHAPWRKLFHWVYGEEQWRGGVVMPSAAGDDLASIVVPREIALDPAHFTLERTDPHPIPMSVIDYVLGLSNPPDGWTI